MVLFLGTGATTIKYNPKSPKALILVLLFASIYLYFRIIFVGPGTPKSEYQKLTVKVEDLEEAIASRSETFKITKFNYCTKCTKDIIGNGTDSNEFFLKPERAHHCSVCNTCVLKMDHHCPWFAVCIGFKNHKNFIQFLILTTLYSITIFFANFFEIKDEIHQNFNSNDDINHLQFKLCYVAFIATIISLTLVVFDWYSIYLLVNNFTTLEKMAFDETRERESLLLLEEGETQKANKINIYDCGSKMENWRQVMGRNWYSWFCFSTKSSQDDCNFGFLFPVNKDVVLQQRLRRRLGAD